MEIGVIVHDGACAYVHKVSQKTNLLHFMQSIGADVNSVCGGNKKCGKCKVRIAGVAGANMAAGDAGAPGLCEAALLTKREIDEGIRLACYVDISSGIELFLDKGTVNAKIETSGIKRDTALEPFIKKRHIKLEKPGLLDQADDVQRLLSECSKVLRKSCDDGKTLKGLYGDSKAFRGSCEDGKALRKHYGDSGVCLNDLSIIKGIPGLLRGHDFEVTCVVAGEKLVGVEPGNTEKSLYGAAFDIGTTTIAAYLYNLATGALVDICPMLNPQRRFGADIISRIGYTLEHYGGLSEMNAAIIEAVNTVLNTFAENNNIKKENIYEIAFVGNTAMMHFLMGLPVEGIAAAPFAPVTTGLHILSPNELGVGINGTGAVICAPGVSGFVGADTVAAVLACNMHRSPDVSLLIDIGTNGEIVLGCSEWMYSCSTAAGPAFEGACIKHGMGGVDGAIDSVRIGKSVEYTTIGEAKAMGICGSGLVDLIAGLLDAGIIDDTGRLLDACGVDVDVPNELKKRLVKIDGINSFVVAGEGEARTGEARAGEASAGEASAGEARAGEARAGEARTGEARTGEARAGNVGSAYSAPRRIAITQKDVREIQNAKAAIAAGIKTLVKHSGIGYGDIANVYLAGGFGNCINKANAVRTGLIPEELGRKAIAVGNAAGQGAIECILSVRAINEMQLIKNGMLYVELSASSEFANEYVECMMFGE